MASRSYLEIGGFSKWCLKLVWVWPFLPLLFRPFSPFFCGWWRGGIAARYLWNAARCQCMPHFDKCKCTLIADAVNTNSSDVSAIPDHPVITTNKTIASQFGERIAAKRSSVTSSLVFSNRPLLKVLFIDALGSSHSHYISFSGGRQFHIYGIHPSDTPITFTKHIYFVRLIPDHQLSIVSDIVFFFNMYFC